MTRTVVVANNEDADVGYVGDRLVDHGARLELVPRDEPDTLADAVGTPDLLVLLGSDWSVHDPAHAQAVAAEADVVRASVARGVPVLAVCYGAQLAASAFGCRVTRAATPEIGWRTITTGDPDLVTPGPWFQIHHDRWWDAGPVRSFAHTDDAPQAFRVGRLLAVQFHPEVTPATAERWLRDAGHASNLVEHEIAQFGEGARLRAGQLVDTFMSAIADAPLSAMGGGMQR